ncbi:HNH endonuclease [Escherichia coli]|uniref:HNH endonuclease n=1 Tax=Escherichia coli TaxID=562 RepID=UPI003B9A1CB4
MGHRWECEIHHKLPRMFGGKNDISNLIPLCKECHREINGITSKFLSISGSDSPSQNSCLYRRILNKIS